jgi:hypothetical protein
MNHSQRLFGITPDDDWTQSGNFAITGPPVQAGLKEIPFPL